MEVKFIIVATLVDTGEIFECFHWTRDAEEGIRRAKADAVKFNMATKIMDYRAIPTTPNISTQGIVS